MAISLHASAASWTTAASGSVVPTLPTHSTGDMLLARVGYKSGAIATCSASTATSGWTKLGEFHDGTINSTSGLGSVAVALFYKEAASASETSPTIDFSQTVNVVAAVSLSYQKAGGETWDTPVGDGGGAAAGTNISATIQSHVSVVGGDMVDIFTVVRDNTTMTVPTITQTGVTYGAVSEQPAAASTTTEGDDTAADGANRLASSGTSSAAGVVTNTLSTSETASAWMTRLRVSVAGDVTVTPGTASLTTTRFTPTVATPRLVTPGIATLTTTRFTPAVTLGFRVTPGIGTLTTTRFTPTVTVTAGLVLTPGTASLVTARFTPSVLTPRTVTPGTAALLTTRFTPAVLTPRLVTPGTVSLTTTRFTPTVTSGAGGPVIGGPPPVGAAGTITSGGSAAAPGPKGKAGHH